MRTVRYDNRHFRFGRHSKLLLCVHIHVSAGCFFVFKKTINIHLISFLFLIIARTFRAYVKHRIIIIISFATLTEKVLISGWCTVIVIGFR